MINYNVLISIERRAPGKTKTTTTNNNQREQTQKIKDEYQGSNEKKREKKIMGRQTKKGHQARFLVRSAELEL